MLQTQIGKNIKELDLKIAKLNEELESTEAIADEEVYDKLTKRLEKLTDLRCKLYESKVSNSSKGIVISGLLSIASVGFVLKYEKTEVITSKAFNMATSMIRGSK